MATIIQPKQRTVAGDSDWQYWTLKAAEDLREIVKRITGAELPIVTEGVAVTGTCILIGDGIEMRSLGINPSVLRSEECLITFKAGNIILTGGKSSSIVWGVQVFLETFCDVRRYAPGEIGLVYQQTNTLRIEGKEIRRQPVFSYRHFWPLMPASNSMSDILLGRPSTDEMSLFWKRLNYGNRDNFICNHSFYSYYDRFWEKNPKKPEIFETSHPDWFSIDIKGQPLLDQGRPAQLCYTHHEVRAMAVKEARNAFDAGQSFFGVVPMDNDDFCQCSRCRTAGASGEGRSAYGWPSYNGFFNGKNSAYVYSFVNAVAREVRKTHPSNYISVVAYASYFTPPNFELEPNVAIQLCLHVGQHDIGWEKLYNSWISREKGKRPMYVWLYPCFPEITTAIEKFRFFPGFTVHATAQAIKNFSQDGIRGVFFNCSPGEIMNQIELYIAYKLLDDPTLDVDVMLDEFFSRFYGPAGKIIKIIYTEIEKTYLDPLNYPPVGEFTHQTREIAWGKLGTPQRVEHWGKLMASAKAAGGNEIEKQRTAFFEEAVLKHLRLGVNEYQNNDRLEELLAILRQQPPPVMQVPRSRVYYEGKASAVDWKNAAVIPLYRCLDWAKGSVPAQAYMLHDKDFLYLMLEIKCDTTKLIDKQDIWSGDAWEIFLATSRERPYRQIMIGPMGNYETYLYEKDVNGAKKVALNIRTTAKIKPDVWQMQVVLPLKEISIGEGNHFFGNIFNSKNQLTISPTFSHNFHQLERLSEFFLQSGSAKNRR